MSERDSLCLVDGSYYIFRAYYALRGLSNSKGFPTNALYGFVGMLRKLIDDISPSHLLVTFDAPGKTFRSDLYPQYKATRDAMPEDLTPQLPLFRDIVKAYNIPVVEEPGVEADDVMATLACKAVDLGFDVTIITGDKDLTQLVAEHIRLYDTMRDKWVGPDEVRDRFQCEPSQVPDVLGLMGDSSDNIPGVPGVGEKTAINLVSKYGSIEGVLENLADFKGKKLGERLREHAEQALLSRKLATIRFALDLGFDPDHARLGRPDLDRLTALFRELEFTKHLEDLTAQYGELPADTGGDDTPTTPAAVMRRYSAVESAYELNRVVNEIVAAGRMALHLESSEPTDPMRADLVGIGLSWSPEEGAYVPLGHDPLREPRQLAESFVLARLKKVLREPEIAKTGLSTKRDWVLLKRRGIDLEGVTFDPSLASYILDPSQSNPAAHVMAMEHLGLKVDIEAQRFGKTPLAQTPVEEVAPWVAERADVALQLTDVLRDKLDSEGMSALHDDLELPLSRVLARMERRGVLINVERLRSLSDELERDLATVEAEIYELAGMEFNVNSPIQLREVLFDKLELPVVKRTKTGPSTDHSVLERLSSEHPVPERILDYRRMSKLKNTYTDALPALVHPETGRIHTDFNQTVAATGRLSSNNPNLQNIPVRTEQGRRIREAFVAPPGSMLFSADYSQVELRILAHMSGDPVLLDAFRRGQDIHARTASELFEVTPDEITKGQRAVAKTINFGLLYGMGTMRLSRELKISRSDANAFVDRYFERIGGVKWFLDSLIEKAQLDGYARTILGRRRPLPELQSRNRGVRALGERLAVNTPIQGSAADIIKVAMVNLQRRLDASSLDVGMLLQVHDELVFEVKEADLSALEALVVEEMQGAVELDVPLLVDASSGATWAEL